MPVEPVKILFLEDNNDDCTLIKYELRTASFSYSSFQVSTKKDFLDALETFKPDVILADYSLPAFNGMHAFKLFREQNICIPFILVTGFLTEEVAMECISEGVDDVVLKSNFKRLTQIIARSLELKKLEQDKQRISEELDRSNHELERLRTEAEKARAHELLSNREFEILCLIAHGSSIKEIASQLNLSPATVATYRARLLEKLNLKSNVDLTLFAVHNKLIDG
jgi:DNA-binding NarL/FixJ family response regulator